MVTMSLGNSKVPVDTVLELCKLYKTTPNELLGFSKNSETIEISKVLKLYNYIKNENINVEELIDFLASTKKLFK